MGKKKQTIGYHYIMTLLFGLCRGPINEIREIQVGGKTAWGGHLCTDDPGVINQPNLFGGKEKEGGVQGGFYLYQGALDQELRPATSFSTATGQGLSSGTGLNVRWASLFRALLNGPVRIAKMRDLRAILPGKVSQLRGLVTFHFNGMISSMNPYPKEWAFRARRTTAGWSNPIWYGSKATIWMEDGKIMGMNGVHMIYEALTDKDWGGSEDIDEIDENSFIGAANTLCSEGFGLCMKWERQSDVDEFIKSVLDHIGAALYTDRETGLYTLKLIRADYEIDDLPLFTPDTGLIEITEDDSEAVADTINEVVATGKNPLDFGNDFQIRVQNIAAIQAVGGLNSNPVSYPGIPTASKLIEVAQRDLKASSLGLKRFTVKLDRRAWRLYPAMPFRIADPANGLAEIVVRVADIEDRSDMSDGFILFKVVEDVFAMPETTFVTVPEVGWEPPVQVALPALEERLLEAGYRDIYLKRGSADVDALTDTDAMIGQLAAAPNVSNREYQLWSRVPPADYAFQSTGFFTDYAFTSVDLGFYDTVLTVTGATGGFVPEDLVGSALLIGNEMIGVVSYDDVLEEFTISRGTADTVPQEHASGTRAWTIDDDIAGDGVRYQAGETVNTQVLSVTASDALQIGDATEQTVTLVARQARPYPPGYVRVDGEMALTLVGPAHPSPVLTWTDRDRTLQDDALVDHLEASIGPEPGTTYRARVYSYPADTLIGTHSGLEGPYWEYTSALQATDGATDRVRVELESVRDGLASWQHYSFYITLNGGYGLGYGYNYGGGVSPSPLIIDGEIVEIDGEMVRI